MSLQRTIVPGAVYVSPEGPEPPPAPRPPRVQALTVLDALYDDGRIRKVQYEAGLEIRGYWMRWTMSHLPKATRFDAVRVDGGSAPEPLAATPMARRYLAWRVEAEARKVKGDLTALQLVLDLCASDWSPWRLREVYRISDTRALRIVQEELLRYAILAGWQEPA